MITRFAVFEVEDGHDLRPAEDGSWVGYDEHVALPSGGIGKFDESVCYVSDAH